MGGAGFYAGADDLCHQWVQADWGGYQEACAGVLFGSGGGDGWDVFVPVLAGEQEVWADHDDLGASFDASGVCGWDGGLGQLHVGGFDDFVAYLVVK